MSLQGMVFQTIVKSLAIVQNSEIFFVDLKSNFALKSNKSHNFLKGIAALFAALAGGGGWA